MFVYCELFLLLCPSINLVLLSIRLSFSEALLAELCLLVDVKEGFFLLVSVCIPLLPDPPKHFLFLLFPNSAKTPEAFPLQEDRREIMEELATLNFVQESLDSQLDLLDVEVTVSGALPPLPRPLGFCPPRPPLPPLPNTGAGFLL